MRERDQNTARDIIDAYRRRQHITQNALFIIAFAVILLVTVGVILLLRFSGTSPPPSAGETQTPTLTETVPLNPTATTTPFPTATSAPILAGTPLVEVTPTETGTSLYEVREGDTLASIAAQFNLDLQTLLSLNPDIDPDLILVGQQIVIPSTRVAQGSATPVPEGFSGLIEYQVVAGDTLLDLANRFNSSVDAIVAENGLENPNDIRAGAVLQIPVNVTEPTPD